MGIRGKNQMAAGIISPFAGSTAPAGWLLCYGQAVSRTAYAALFAAIGTVYGVGDGATTFNLPDLRGRALFGKDDMGGAAANRLTSGGGGVAGATLGAVGGGETVTLTTAQMPSHAHSTSFNTSPAATAGIVQTTAVTASATAPTAVSTSSAGTGGAHANVPPALVANYIIKT